MREYLINMRKNKKLTQEQVSNDLNISRAFYAMIESGKRNPTLDLAKQIAEYFNTDLEKLFFENQCHVLEQVVKLA